MSRFAWCLNEAIRLLVIGGAVYALAAFLWRT